MYKVSADVNRQLIVLSIYILSVLNVYMYKVDIKELLDADWMSVRLKKKIIVVLLIKSMFIWNAAQSEKNLCVI